MASDGCLKYTRSLATDGLLLACVLVRNLATKLSLSTFRTKQYEIIEIDFNENRIHAKFYGEIPRFQTKKLRI